MSTDQGQPTLQELMSRVAALEQAHASLLAELTSARGAPAPVATDAQMYVATALAPTSTQGNFASSNPNTPAVTASGTLGAIGVQASSDRGFGVSGQSDTNIGVSGQSNSGIGVEGSSTGSGTGVSGQSNSGIGVSGQSNTGLAGQFLGNVTVDGHLSSGTGTFASGVQAVSDSGIGVSGQSTGSVGVLGRSSSGNGVGGGSESGAGVSGSSVSGPGLRGESTTGLAGEFIGNVSVSGKVGIGTASPADPLQVETVTDTYGITQTNGAITAGTYVGGSAFGGGFGTKSNHPLSFYVNGNPSMTLATNGNVGIGLLAPQAKLDISSGATEGVHITNTSEDPFALMINNTTVGSTDATGFGLWQSNTGIAVLTNHNHGAVSIDPSGNVGIGTTTPSAQLTVQGAVSVSTNLTVGGNIDVTGDVVLTGADCAEEFDIADVAEIEPGTVMVLDEEGVLHQSQQAYDKRVAGVISDAGSYRPGLILDRRQARGNRLPIALVGKVYCKVDARYAPIAVGDLLTTSSTPGHAMKAADPVQAFGAVIGKALRSLEAGQGMIPILVALQ